MTDSRITEAQQRLQSGLERSFHEKLRVTDFQRLFESAVHEQHHGLPIFWLVKYTGMIRTLLDHYTPEQLLAMIREAMSRPEVYFPNGIAFPEFYRQKEALATKLSGKEQASIQRAAIEQASQPPPPSADEMDPAFWAKMPASFREQALKGMVKK